MVNNIKGSENFRGLFIWIFKNILYLVAALNEQNMKSPVTPSVGRTVIFVWPEDKTALHNNGAAESPAVIVRTWENTGYENDEVNLKVLADGPNDDWQTSVPYSETNEPRTWHWPPKV